jgi:hypothetical protein
MPMAMQFGPQRPKFTPALSRQKAAKNSKSARTRLIQIIKRRSDFGNVLLLGPRGRRRAMLNRDRDSDRRRGKRNLLDAMIQRSAWLWWNNLRDRIERRWVQENWSRSTLHLV